MKISNAYLVAAFAIAFSVLLIIPMWAAYGVLFPKDAGHGHGHGAGEMVTAAQFEEKMARFIEARGLPDGSVRAEDGKPIYVLATQYTFTPNTLRLRAGEQYELQMLSKDVVHAFSVQMGGTSYNAVVMPKTVTSLRLKPTKPGKHLIICNEYCGIGHDYMYFSIVVESAQDGKPPGMSKEEHGQTNNEQQKKTSPATKSHTHGKH